jgi:hypothetical protein
LALRGSFSTDGLSRPSSAPNPFPPFFPCLTLVLDPSTLFAIGARTGKCKDMLFLGDDSIKLDLDEESG